MKSSLWTINFRANLLRAFVFEALTALLLFNNLLRARYYVYFTENISY